MIIQPPTAAHWPQVRAIYEQGIAAGRQLLPERRSLAVGTPVPKVPFPSALIPAHVNA